MIHETGNTESTSFPDEANHTPDEANRGPTSDTLGQVKDLGMKSLAPLLEVFIRHKSDLSPYLNSLTKALKSGAQSLQGVQSSAADKFIAQYFTDGADWITKWKDKVSGNSPEEMMLYLEEEGRKQPAILFGVSYVAGLILGRFGRHLGKSVRTGKENIH